MLKTSSLLLSVEGEIFNSKFSSIEYNNERKGKKMRHKTHSHKILSKIQ